MSRATVQCSHNNTGMKTRKLSRKSSRRMLTLCRQPSSSLTKEDIDDNKEELERLIDIESPDLNLPRCHGSIPLCEACRSGNQWAVEVLLDKGADVNVSDKNKCTPVYIAASHGYTSILQKLLDRRADVNIKNLQGYLPLMSAVENNQKVTAEMLVDEGADVDILRPNTFGISMTLMTFVLFAKNDISFADKILDAGVCPHTFEESLNFILLEYGEECREFVKKLVYAGFNLYCDGWIRSTSKHRTDISESEHNMIDFLKYEYSNAPRLERLCRTAIRTALSKSQLKCHIRLKVDQLPLPNEIKKYVMLQHL